MQTIRDIRRLLSERGLEPKRSLGQNFLIDRRRIEELVRASEVGPGDRVLEVGPGTGALTESLLATGAEVVAVELDAALVSLLEDTLVPASEGRLRLIEADCLANKREVNPAVLEAMGDGPWQMVANLPYGAGTPLLLALLTRVPACRSMNVTVQLEVAQRFQASPGDDAFGSISVVAAALGEASLIGRLPPGCFWPAPKVDSAMLSIVRRSDPMTSNGAVLADVCQQMFTQRRKLARRVVERVIGVEPPASIGANDRVSTLSVRGFCDVADAVAAIATDRSPTGVDD